MVLKVSELTKRFGGSVAIDNVNIDFDRPRMVGIIGLSGAGKSTLLRMINRQTDASEGVIAFEGQDVANFCGAEAHRWQTLCAMICRQLNLVPRLDVASNVAFGAPNRFSTLRCFLNIFPHDDLRRAIDILDRLGNAEYAPKRTEALPEGLQRRVAIARALMQDPKVILADAPIASLDPTNAGIVMDTLRRIHDEDGRLVICSLRAVDIARKYCDRVIGLRDGRVVFDGVPEQLTVDVARDIYGDDERHLEAVKATGIGALEQAGLAEPVPA